MSRSTKIAQSIVEAITNGEERQGRSLIHRIVLAISIFFTLYRLRFQRYRDDLFHALRTQTWKMDETAYEQTFDDEEKLKPTGDMGYSGSVSTRTLLRSQKLSDNFGRHSTLLRMSATWSNPFRVISSTRSFAMIF